MTSGDEVLSRALERRAHAAREICEIDAFLTTYAALAGVSLEALLGSQEDAGVALSPSRLQLEKASIRRGLSAQSVEADDPGAGMPQREFTDLAKELLLANGRPMQSRPLLDAFHEIGRRIGGKDELRNLTTKLWRAGDEITKVPGAGYWPIDAPCPAVRYVPPAHSMGNRAKTQTDDAPAFSPGDPRDAEREEREDALSEQIRVSRARALSQDDLDDEIPF